MELHWTGAPVSDRPTSIVSLALDLKLSVVAEGVETQDEVARLKDMGCEYGQGYLLGGPVPASEINGVIVKAQAR